MSIFGKKIAYTTPSFTIYKGKQSGHDFSASFDMNLYKYGDRKQFPNMIGISIQKFKTQPNGLPEASAFSALNAQEDQIMELFTKANIGHYAGHSYWNGALELIFYTSDFEKGQVFLDMLVKTKMSFPVVSKLEPDETWKNFSQFIGRGVRVSVPANRKIILRNLLVSNAVALLLVIILFMLPSANTPSTEVNFLYNFLGISGLLSILYLFVQIPIFLYSYRQNILYYLTNPAILIYRISGGRWTMFGDPYDMVMVKWFDSYGNGFLTDDIGASNIQSKADQDKTLKGISGLAESFRKDFKDPKLDYSPESLKIVDQIILSPILKQVVKASDPKRMPNQFIGVMTEISGYVLEVVSRNLKGEIIPNNPIWTSMVLLGEKGSPTASVGLWPIKCFANGKSDSVWSKYLVAETMSEKKPEAKKLVKQISIQDSEGWNQMITTCMVSDPRSLNAKQKIAYYALWYDSEVQNGGHLQYFENKKGRGLTDTLVALETIGAFEQKKILEKAKQLFLDETRPPVTSVEEFNARALEGKYADLDKAYCTLKKDTNDFLVEYLKENKQEVLKKPFWK